MSRRELLRRIAQSCSGRPSRTGMTKTKRSNGSSARIRQRGILGSYDALDDRKPDTILATIVYANDLSGPREHCKEPRARVRRSCSTEMKCVMNGVEAQ